MIWGILLKQGLLEDLVTSRSDPDFKNPIRYGMGY